MPKKQKAEPEKIALIMPVVNRFKSERKTKKLAFGGYTFETRTKKKIKNKIKKV